MLPKILHIVPALLGPDGVYGGAERYALELARAQRARADVRLVAFGPHPRHQRDGSLDIFVLRNWLTSSRFAGSPAGPGLLPHLRWADIVHCHQTHTMSSSVALLYTRLDRKPIFAIDQNGGGLCLQSFLDTSGWYTAHLWISESTRRHSHAPTRHYVVWGGVDASRFCPDPAVPRDGGVLYAGRLIPSKGVAYLVRALPPGLPLTVLGPESDPAFAASLRLLARDKSVAFLPPAGDQGLIAAYRRATVAVLPSLAHFEDGRPVSSLPEPFGLTLVEAMACGTPVICTSVGGMPEIVVDGVTGFIVPPNDTTALAAKIDWLRRHPDQAEAMGQAARARVLQHFTWEAVAARCLTAYGFPSAP